MITLGTREKSEKGVVKKILDFVSGTTEEQVVLPEQLIRYQVRQVGVVTPLRAAPKMLVIPPTPLQISNLEKHIRKLNIQEKFFVYRFYRLRQVG